MASFTKVRARATLQHGHKDGRGIETVKSGDEFELETHEAERLHRLRLADIIGEQTEKLEEPPPLQNAKGKKSGEVLPPSGADGQQNAGGGS